MAQVWLREYDAKRKFFESISTPYKWVLISSVEDIDLIDFSENIVLKPDMLFWKRGKYGLVGVNLTKKEAKVWLEERLWKEFEIDIMWKKVKDTLDTFIAEPFISHEEEYYVSFDTARDGDIIRFSNEWWIDIEENWDSVKELKIGVTDSLKDYMLELEFGIESEQIKSSIISLFSFFRDFSCTYLEVNPFCFDVKTGNIVVLDMVCKVDDTAYFMQRNTWADIDFPNSFWYSENESERLISDLDKWTWASLKFKILNPDAKIWTLLSWWGGSLIFTDTLWALGYSDQIWNYWECSWNPDKDSTREYTKIILKEMLKNGKKWKYLIIWWAIANFTHIDKTFAWIIEAFKIYKSQIISQDVKILVRRWWINDRKGLNMLKDECEKMWFNIKVADSKEYMTDILKEIKL